MGLRANLAEISTGQCVTDIYLGIIRQALFEPAVEHVFQLVKLGMEP